MVGQMWGKPAALVVVRPYMNDVPEAVMDRLALEGAMIKQAFMAYGYRF